VRPTASEVIRGVSRSLFDEILPELSSPWSQAQLRYALTALDTVANEWDAAVENLVRENARLEVFCRSAEEATVGFPDERLAAIARPLSAVLELSPPPDLRVGTLSERNNALWRAIEPLIEFLAATDEGPKRVVALRAELQSMLRDYVIARQYRKGG
jgi:hypothetical protein